MTTREKAVNRLIIAATALALALAMVHSRYAHSEETKAFWDEHGHFSGSSSTYNDGRNSSYYDRDGHFSGSAIRNSDGTTSLYDARGHFTGSVTNTTQPGQQHRR